MVEKSHNFFFPDLKSRNVAVPQMTTRGRLQEVAFPFAFHAPNSDLITKMDQSGVLTASFSNDEEAGLINNLFDLLRTEM